MLYREEIITRLTNVGIKPTPENIEKYLALQTRQAIRKARRERHVGALDILAKV